MFPANSMRSRTFTVLRLFLGIFLLVLLVRWVGWEKLAPVFAAPRWGFLGASLGFSALLIGISCAKWQLLLRHLGIQVRFGRLIALYVIGILFNQVLPSNVGGDVVRSYGLGRFTRGMPGAFATVFLERFTGFAALVCSAWVGVFMQPAWLHEPLLIGALGLTTTAFAAVLLVLLDQRPRHILQRFTPVRISSALDSFALALSTLGDSWLLARAMVLSFGFYILAIANVWVTAGIFDIFPSPTGLAIAVPMVLLVAMLPVSPGGIGTQEWAFVICLGRIGVPEELAVATALALRAKVFILGLVGAVLVTTMRWEPHDNEPTESIDGEIVSPSETR